MIRHPALSIRSVLIGLGVLSILIAAGLAGFGLLGTQLQTTALERVIVLEQALHNHNSADAFMDNLRADVLRALQTSVGTNPLRANDNETLSPREFSLEGVEG